MRGPSGDRKDEPHKITDLKRLFLRLPDGVFGFNRNGAIKWFLAVKSQPLFIRINCFFCLIK